MRIIIFATLAPLLVFSGCAKPIPQEKEKVILGNREIQVEVMKTAEEKSQGLIGHSPLSSKEGMLFVFVPKSQPTFWMKDMDFPIDIVWLSNWKVVGSEENVPPDEGQTLYTAPDEIDYVLELRAGYVRDNNIKNGDNFSRYK